MLFLHYEKCWFECYVFCIVLQPIDGSNIDKLNHVFKKKKFLVCCLVHLTQHNELIYGSYFLQEYGLIFTS